MQMLGHFWALATIFDWPWSHAAIDPMPDKMNLDYCEFQNYEFMTMSVVGGQPKKQKSQWERNKTPQMPFSNLWSLLVVKLMIAAW